MAHERCVLFHEEEEVQAVETMESETEVMGDL